MEKSSQKKKEKKRKEEKKKRERDRVRRGMVEVQPGVVKSQFDRRDVSGTPCKENKRYVRRTSVFEEESGSLWSLPAFVPQLSASALCVACIRRRRFSSRVPPGIG